MGGAQSAEIEGRTLKFKRKIADGTNSQIIQVKSVKGGGAAGGAAAAVEGESLAVKRLLINSGDANAIENAKWEIKLHKSVPKSPYVVGYEGARIMTNPNGSGVEVLILMEYCGGGTLSDMVKERQLSLDEVLRTFSHICGGVAACHAAKPPVIHRDIRAENVWLHTESGAWKLGDFGSATQEVVTCRTPEDRHRMEAIIERCTQPASRAPEMVDLYSGTPLSTALDIWALGCLFYTLLFRQQPFPTGKLAILSGKYQAVAHQYPAPVITFLNHMLTVDAKQRPTIVQVQAELKALIAGQPLPQGKAAGHRPGSSSLSAADFKNAAASGFGEDWNAAAAASGSEAKTTPVSSPHNGPAAAGAGSAALGSVSGASSSLSTELQKSLHKATSHELLPPKLKHVRALVQASWTPVPPAPTPMHTPAATDATRPNAACKACKQQRTGLPGVISNLEKRLLMRNDVIVFKCLQLLHRLIAHGAPEMIGQMFAELHVLGKVKKQWAAQNSLGASAAKPSAADAEFAKSPVADLISIYADYLERRVLFCHKYPRYEGNFAWCNWLAPMLQDKDNANALAAASLASGTSSTGLVADPNELGAGGAPQPAAALLHTHVHSAASTFEYFARTVKDDSTVAALLALCAHAIGVGEVVTHKPGLAKEGKDFRENVLLQLLDDVQGMHRAATFEFTQLCLATGVGAEFVLDPTGLPPDPNAAIAGPNGQPLSPDSAAAATAAAVAGASGSGAAAGGAISASTKQRSLDEEGAMTVILRSLLVQYRGTCARMEKLIASAKHSAALTLATADRPIHITPISFADLFVPVSSVTASQRLPPPSNFPALKAHNTLLCARFQEQMALAGAARKAARAQRRQRAGSGVHAHAQVHVSPVFNSHNKLTKAHSESANALTAHTQQAHYQHSASSSPLGTPTAGHSPAAHQHLGHESSGGSGDEYSSQSGVEGDDEAARRARISQKRGTEKSKSLDKQTVVRLKQSKSKSLEKKALGGGPGSILIPPPDHTSASTLARKKLSVSGQNSPHPAGAATPSPPLGPSAPGGAKDAKGWAVDWDDDSSSSVSPHTSAPPLLPVIYAPTPNNPQQQTAYNPSLPVILSNDALYNNNTTNTAADPNPNNYGGRRPSSGDETANATAAMVTTALHTSPQVPLQQGTGLQVPGAGTGMSGILNSFDPLTPQHRALQAPSPVVGSSTPTASSSTASSLPRQGSSERLSSLPPSAATHGLQPGHGHGHTTRVTHRPPNMRIKVDGNGSGEHVSASAPTVGTPHSPKTPHSATDRRTPSPSTPAGVPVGEVGPDGQPSLGRSTSEADERRKRSATAGVTPSSALTGAPRKPDDVFAIFDPIQAIRRNTAPVGPQVTTVAPVIIQPGGPTGNSTPSPTHGGGAGGAGDVAPPPQQLGILRRDSHELQAAQPEGGPAGLMPRSPKRVSPTGPPQQMATAAPSSQHGAAMYGQPLGGAGGGTPVMAPVTHTLRGGGGGIEVDQFAALEYRNQLLQRQEMERRQQAAAAAAGGMILAGPPAMPPAAPLNGATTAAFYTPFGAAPNQTAAYYQQQQAAAAAAAAAAAGAGGIAPNPQQFYSVQKAPVGYVPASAMGSTHMGAGAGLMPAGAAAGPGPALNTNQLAVDPTAAGGGAAAGNGGGLFADFNPLKASGIAVAATSTAGVQNTRNPRAGKIGRTSGSGGVTGIGTNNPQLQVRPGAAGAVANPPTGMPAGRPQMTPIQQTLTNALNAEQAAAVGTAGGAPNYPPPKYQTSTPVRAPNTAINNSPTATVNGLAAGAAPAAAPARAGVVPGAQPAPVAGAAAPSTNAAAAGAGKKVDHFTQFDPFQDPALKAAMAQPATVNRGAAAAAAGGAASLTPAQLYQQQQAAAQAAANQRNAAAATGRAIPPQPQPLQAIKSVVAGLPQAGAQPGASPSVKPQDVKLQPAPPVQPVQPAQPAAKSPTTAAGVPAAAGAGAGAGAAAAAVAAPPPGPPPAAAASQSLIAMGDEDTGEIDFSELTLGKRIGMGAFAEVFTGVWRGTDVAIKKLIIHPNSGQDVITEFKAEVKMLRKLRHPHIVLFMAASTKLPNLCVVTELLQGSLFDLLHNSNIKLSWKLRLQIALDTARGMTFLHLGGIIHRDLKSPNLLLDAKYRVKVADFGLARTKAVNTMTGQCGTFQWMAPEVIESTHYTEKADVFSFAIILWELVARAVPYSGMNAVQVSVAVMTKDVRPPIPDKCPPAYAQLIRDCWDKDPNKRPAFPLIVDSLQAFIRQASNPE